MTNTIYPTEITDLTDNELLSLYLSLSPTVREQTFITTTQAAEITGVSKRTIQFWIECGVVRALSIGRKYKIVLRSLRAHLEDQMGKRDR